MFTFAGFAELVIRASPDHIDAVLDEVLERRDEPQLARLPIDDREIDDPEADLQLRLLEEIVQHDIRLLTAFQLEDDAHAVAIAFVADFGNAFNLLLVDQ